MKLKHVGNAPILKNYMLNFKKNTDIKLIKVYSYVKESLKNHLKQGDSIVRRKINKFIFYFIFRLFIAMEISVQHQLLFCMIYFKIFI